MVTVAGAPAGADRVRSLNLPQPVAVRVDAQSGLPYALRERQQWRKIERIQDMWHVDDEWWREPISRRYIQVVLRGGTLRTLFHDRINDRWFTQTY
jgi:hypothetical protein